MRRVERPPVIIGKWEYEALVDELVRADKMEEVFEINDQSYPYWEKWKYLAKDWNIDAKKLWYTVKIYRGDYLRINFESPIRPLMFVNTPSVLQQQLHELDLGLGGNLHTSELIPSQEKQRYLVSSLMEEAIASSQLEGAATTRKIAKEMLESKRKPVNLSEQMISNNYEIMQWIIVNKDRVLSPEVILEIHSIITKNTLNDKKDEGAFRTSDDVRIVDVQTGAVVHIPPTFGQLDILMKEFCLFANNIRKEKFFMHPITKAIIVHFLIGYIHPFADGNGRTARALFYWYLVGKGYWLIEYMSVSRVILGSKAQYARAYQHTEMDANDLTYFVLYNLKAISSALADLKKYIKRKNDEKNEMLSLLRDTDLNERQVLLLRDILQDEKNSFTVSELETRFAVSNQTARNDLNRLVTMGILHAKKKGKKIQFIATPDAAKILKGNTHGPV